MNFREIGPWLVGVPLGFAIVAVFAVAFAPREPNIRFIAGDRYLCNAYWEYRKAGYAAVDGMEEFCLAVKQ